LELIFYHIHLAYTYYLQLPLLVFHELLLYLIYFLLYRLLNYLLAIGY